MTLILRLLKGRSGATATEYGVALALLVVGVYLFIEGTGLGRKELLSDTSGRIEQAINKRNPESTPSVVRARNTPSSLEKEFRPAAGGGR